MTQPSQPSQPSLLGLAWPLIISFTLRSLLTAVDLPYASRLEDPDAAIAAIGLAFPLEFTFIACWVGASSALTSYLSRAMGERDAARLEQLLATARTVVLALAGVFGLCAVGCYFAAPWLPVEDAVIANFQIYAPILLLGAATVGFWSILPDSLVKAHHDMKTTMLAGLTTGITNLVLNTLFVFGFGWGITGIAIATACGRLGGFLVSWTRCRTLEAQRAAEWASLDPSELGHAPLERPLSALLKLGVPSALTYVLMASESLFANWILVKSTSEQAATANMAAYAIYHRAGLLFLMPVIAVSVAVNPFVARAYGAGQLQRIGQSLRQGYLYAFGYAVGFALPLCWLVGEPLAQFLSKAEATKDLAALGIRYGVPFAALASGPMLLARPAFEAVQRGAPGLLMSALRYVVLAVPFGWVGVQLAIGQGRPPLVGLIGGLVAATAVVSVAITVWLVAMVRGLTPPGPRNA
ncbi:MAG: MATE family efflux transporter [Planctomycetes bacterium]|nr:MATE family efflux transporter [Planctomycetota bacterium]